MAKKNGWNWLPCPACKQPSPPAATRCPVCQIDYTAEQVAKRTKEARVGAGGAIGCLTVLVLGALIYTCSGSAAPPDQPTATAKDDAVKFYQAVIDAGRGCDSAGRQLEPALKAGDVVVAYQVADNISNECLGTSSAIREIEAPLSLGKEHHDLALKAREDCANMYTSKWSAAGTLKKALDGDIRASTMASLRSSASDIEKGQLVCAARLAVVASGVGAKPEDLVIRPGGQPK